MLASILKAITGFVMTPIEFLKEAALEIFDTGDSSVPYAITVVVGALLLGVTTTLLLVGFGVMFFVRNTANELAILLLCYWAITPALRFLLGALKEAEALMKKPEEETLYEGYTLKEWFLMPLIFDKVSELDDEITKITEAHSQEDTYLIVWRRILVVIVAILWVIAIKYVGLLIAILLSPLYVMLYSYWYMKALKNKLPPRNLLDQEWLGKLTIRLTIKKEKKNADKDDG